MDCEEDVRIQFWSIIYLPLKCKSDTIVYFRSRTEISLENKSWTRIERRSLIAKQIPYKHFSDFYIDDGFCQMFTCKLALALNINTGILKVGHLLKDGVRRGLGNHSRPSEASNSPSKEILGLVGRNFGKITCI